VSEYHHSGHAVWDIKYHLVWITKYRYQVLRGEVAERARDLLREICAAREVRIVRGAVSPDHLHMLVVAPPQLAPAKLVQFLKGRSSRMLQRDFQHLRKRYWGQHLWARGYFCASLEPALSRSRFRRLQPQADFQSKSESIGFSR
jgi:putative transposase